MSSYIIRRLFQTVLVLFVLSFVTYGLMTLMPGDPLDIACAANPKCTPENLAHMKHNLGLDQPVYKRYGAWLSGMAHGDFGYSRIYRQPVTTILGPRLLNTIYLSGTAFLVSLIIAIPLGVFTSLRAGSKLDYVVNFFAFMGISTPSFWLGLILMLLFSVKLGLFPAGGVETIGDGTPHTWFAIVRDHLWYLVLPVISLSAQTIAGWVRFTRSSMMTTMRHDFIRTARAKGISKSRVISHHGLRNSLLSVVTVISGDFSMIFAGAIITETVFSYQGIGKLMLDSISGNDFNVAMCAFIIGCVAVLLMNLLADICYAYLDPRISYE